MEETIFSKIINGEIPSHKIYEDDKTLAFLDIHPKTPGHVLVVPKTQVAYAWDLSDDDYHAVMATVKKVALRIREVLNPQFVGEQIVGVDVPHVHVHVFAFDTIDEYRSTPDMGAEPDHASLSAMAQRLAF